jgi:hypothetical protein
VKDPSLGHEKPLKRKRHAPAKIIRYLRTAEQLINQGQSFADSCSDLKASS